MDSMSHICLRRELLGLSLCLHHLYIYSVFLCSAFQVCIAASAVRKASNPFGMPVYTITCKSASLHTVTGHYKLRRAW